MGNSWTNEQLKAIEDKNSNILVAAAAGSGKTTVLVERMIRKVINDGIDIDKILVVTFTNAAASEMREKMLNALYKEIDKDPNNLNLRKQIILLNKASICTIDSFCLDIIRNNFFEIGISSNFRIADTNELELIKQEALEDTLESLYIENSPEFNNLVENYAGYKDDDDLKSLILKIYDFIQSAPFPEDWLREKEKIFLEKEEDFSKTKWGKILIKNFNDEIENSIVTLKGLKKQLSMWPELVKYELIIDNDIQLLEGLIKDNISWDEKYELCSNYNPQKWISDKKINNSLKDDAKNIRTQVKDRVKKLIGKTFIYDTKNALKDLNEMAPTLNSLINVVLLFQENFMKKKAEKNIMDFSDIEHFALKILLKKNEDGVYKKTEVAKKYEKRFEEIAIDEYQDSNEVQEYILKAVSKGNNIFMVGDVKQSIYKFRQARPELFMDKYEKFGENQANECGEKIKLYKNFRSRENVLDLTNEIFANIMSKDFGEIEYSSDEYLNYAATYYDESKEKAEMAELDIIDLKENIDEKDAEDEENIEEDFSKTEIEAKYVAKRIKELVEGKFQVLDKEKGLRNITYKDIVILLRATSNYSNIFEKELANLEIPVFSDVADNYLETIEIQTIIATLKIIDNPLRDIPLVTVMRSFIGGFTDNELLEIRLCHKDGLYYEALKEAKNSKDISEELKNKISTFLEKIEKWRAEEKYLPLNELIWNIYTETNYLNYVTLMPNGKVRRANLNMLFERAKEYEKISFKGLFNFIRYIERLKNSNNDMSSAKLIGENENVVRIMSIHKSKGLEFPVTILAGSDKKFNERDFSEKLLLHQDLGFGPQYINYGRQISYTTAAKEAIKIKARDEMLAEEMRVLYVALTRAKEKLIITGTEKDFNKKIDELKEALNNYEKENGKINHLLLKKYKTYLGWLELIYLNQKEKVIKLNVINKTDILKNDLVEEKETIKIDLEGIKTDRIEKVFKWKYSHIESSNIQSKMSVTKIKELKTVAETKKKQIEIIPNFMKEEKITATEKGTIMHLVLQKLDLKEEYSEAELISFIENLYERKTINLIQKNSINVKKLFEILNSDFMKKLSKAKEIHKEMPFYTYVPMKEVYKVSEDEKILVQGIIDLYYIDEKDRLILVDYKTDFVNSKNELIDKYKVQLELYKKALEESLERKVDESYIYSIYLNQEIKI